MSEIEDFLKAIGVERPVAHVEDPAIDPARFDNIIVGAQFTPGSNGERIDLSFGNLDLEDAADFFKYLSTEQGEDQLAAVILQIFVKSGVISPADALAIYLS